MSNLPNLLRIATRRSATSKRTDHSILVLQWLGVEPAVKDLVACVREGAYVGPVICLDDFTRQGSRIKGFGKPLHAAVPEPNDRLAVYQGFEALPEKISVLFVGHETPPGISTEAIRRMSKGSFVVFPEGKVRSRREAYPRLVSGAFIGAQIV